MNIIFYSNKCEHSQKLIKKIKDNDLLKIFKLIQIDNNKKIPKYIDKVPTIIVKNINKPLVGNEAFKWLDTISSFGQITNNINFNYNKNVKDSINQLTNNMDKLKLNTDDNDYVKNDMYAYLDENKEDKTMLNGSKMNLFEENDKNMIKLENYLQNRNNQKLKSINFDFTNIKK